MTMNDKQHPQKMENLEPYLCSADRSVVVQEQLASPAKGDQMGLSSLSWGTKDIRNEPMGWKSVSIKSNISTDLI